MKEWALILGSSSGFGAATSIELAKKGYHIIGVHFDRRENLPKVEEIINKIKSFNVEAVFFNLNAADPKNRELVLNKVEEKFKNDLEENSIYIVLHSLAFGTLRKFIDENKEEAINQKQVEMTLDVMANQLIYWVQDIFYRGLFKKGGRIFALVSSGDDRVFPYYGAVSGAKAAIEAFIRQLAYELAPFSITANAIKAGVTDTPALRKIPQYEKLIDIAIKKNPSKRLTTPEDVGKAIAVLCDKDLYWMTGNVIRVDGGEDISA
ncbi:MAG: SDR family oxidoreductase [Caldisericia bacterium]|nr:SDR family oxidoreductase [Caldisericia bacterium]